MKTNRRPHLTFALLFLLTVASALARETLACVWTNEAGVPYKDSAGNDIVGIDTGLGCIPVGEEGITKWVVRAVFGIAGGITLLMFILGGIEFATSSGDPKAIDEARGRISSAVAGLILIVFSILILKIIGVDVLGLPGFGGPGGGGVSLP